jgi:hypothetical protein
VSWFREEWPTFILAVFAVASGQIGRLGSKVERGETLSRRTAFIELSMLPAFGSMVGAFASEKHLPVWQILGLGITAGWLGFFTFRLIAKAVMGALRLVAKEATETPK